MTGHVFHPGHHELHGITVVVDTRDGRTYVGRFDKEDTSGMHLLNVAIHDEADTTTSREEYLRRTVKFGVRAEQKHLVVPAGDVVSIRRLAELQ